MARKRFATPTGRKKKTVVIALSIVNAVGEVDTLQKDEGLPLLQCRCSLSHFSKNVGYWKIDDRRWALLKTTPFGKLMKDILEVDYMNAELVDALLGFWDEEHCGFLIAGGIIPFTVDDVALITGVPNRGFRVVRPTICSKSDTQSFHVNRIYLRMGLIEHELDRILSKGEDPNPDEDKHFVQFMILYLWVSVMFPNSSRSVSSYMADYLVNLDEIGSYNWAKAIHSFLVKEINVKSRILKVRNEGKKVGAMFLYGLCFVINAWFYEHVDFGEDSRPSDPDVKPRMLKWVKACKFWRRKPFLQRLREIGEDRVSVRLLPENEELELLSPPAEQHMPSQIGGSDNVVRGDPSLVGNSEDVGSDLRAGDERVVQKGGEVEEDTKETEEKIEKSGEVKRLKEVVDMLACEMLKLSARISALERRNIMLETLAVSNGWEINEGKGDDLSEHEDGEVDEEADDGAIEGKVDHDSITGTLHESCMLKNKGHMVKNGECVRPGRIGLCKEKEIAGEAPQEEIGQWKLRGIARGVKQGHQLIGKRKNSPITKEHLMPKRKREILKEQVSISSKKLVLLEQNLARFERKDNDRLVNLDDYAGPIELKKEPKVAPLNYVGRELLLENERNYLDAFCRKPMQRDDVVFFDCNIVIRRQSMVEYLQGGYTGEEIIDAYARILYERANAAEDKFASFLYVPYMFLGLYRNRLGSYKTFLKAMDKKSLENVKFLFLPCHISNSNHWMLLVCDMEMQKWNVFDSLYDPRHREVAKEQRILLTEYLYQGHGFDARPWRFEYRKIYPQQEPGTLDCGVFVMKFIETIINVPRAFNFRGADMRSSRAQIACEILRHN